MRLDQLDFSLPKDLIATHPPSTRDGGRLLVLGSHAAPSDRLVTDLPELLPQGALVVGNNTKVIPARLLGVKAPSGGKVELMLIRKTHATTAPQKAVHSWKALGKTSKPMRFPLEVLIGANNELRACVVGRDEHGLLDVLLDSPLGMDLEQALALVGHVPLPPYLHRPAHEMDCERYQTLLARVPGAVAAPTAGLHLSSPILERFALRNIRVVTVTLHVGLGTFQPVSAEDLDEHTMHEEWLEVSEEVACEVAQARERQAPVVAIGTTVVRALESAADPDRNGYVNPCQGTTALLIQPGFHFRVVDQLLTNFHLPRSTLLALVAAFGGRSAVLNAYQHAIQSAYRFYSYGDAMLLTGRVSLDEAAT